jgi:hypothetical protein
MDVDDSLAFLEKKNWGMYVNASVSKRFRKVAKSDY